MAIFVLQENFIQVRAFESNVALINSAWSKKSYFSTKTCVASIQKHRLNATALLSIENRYYILKPTG